MYLYPLKCGADHLHTYILCPIPIVKLLVHLMLCALVMGPQVRSHRIEDQVGRNNNLSLLFHSRRINDIADDMNATVMERLERVMRFDVRSITR
jgi:hypothetical protein